MNVLDIRLALRGISACIGVGLVLASGCKQTPVDTTAKGATNSRAGGKNGLGKFDPTGASICLQQMIKNPEGPFHLSFLERKSDGESSSVEADVTPAAIDYTKLETSAGATSTSSKKLERAQLSEMELDFDIMGPVPWHGELVAAQDAVRAEGKESVNGYEALKYAMDTANEPAAQKATFDSLMAVKDYEIAGQAWVTTDTGCLVKYSIDLTKNANNGKVTKAHFEGNVTRK